ncbi:MAG: CHAT domain-containing protein, partial [Candidatus Zixiibacteriota bacterium]
IDRHSFHLSPTLQHLGHASRLRCTGKRMRVFVGEVSGLEHTRRELTNIAKMRPDADIIEPCQRRDWPDEGQWFAWHYIGHARHRSDNPAYSSLTLKDGPLFGADLRLKRCRVGLVTLAACRTAHQSVLPGEESTGLIRCLLEMGTRNVVGSHWAVSDKSAAAWMSSFYESLLSGQAVPAAVREASLKIRETFRSAYDWASFSVFGAG